jgi:hypothetical protein
VEHVVALMVRYVCQAQSFRIKFYILLLVIPANIRKLFPLLRICGAKIGLEAAFVLSVSQKCSINVVYNLHNIKLGADVTI